MMRMLNKFVQLWRMRWFCQGLRILLKTVKLHITEFETMKHQVYLLSAFLLSFSGCAEQPGKKKEDKEEKTEDKTSKPAKDTKQAEAVKDDIGYMSQRFGLYPDLTVDENIQFYADLYGVPTHGREQKIHELLSFSNLTPFKKRQAGRLSGGMKQKLGLACALIHTPKVLFLDEPTNGVDPVSRRDFWRILYSLLKEGVTIFVSTAYLDEAERCHRVALLHQGRLLACDTPDRVKRLMRGTILEVRVSRAREAAALLKRRMNAESIGLFGDRIHVVTMNRAQTVHEVPDILQGEGFTLHGVRQIEPSLEDVFISVVTGKQAAVQQESTHVLRS